MKKSTFIKIPILVVIFGAITIFAVHLDRAYREKQVMQIGLTKGQNDYFQEQLQETGKFFSPYKSARYLFKKNNINDALILYQKALDNAYSDSTTSLAYRGLADVYEKRKDYKKSLDYLVIIRDKHVNDWAKAPIEERIKYLEYAANGEYGLAVEQAEKALIVETNMPYNKGVPSEEFVQRVNDLKASKEYIESLKK